LLSVVLPFVPPLQTNIIMALGLTFPIGMVLGPATNLLTHYFHNAKNQVTIPGANITLTDNSSPGLLLACLLLVAHRPDACCFHMKRIQNEST
jgi:hypothetical protein